MDQEHKPLTAVQEQLSQINFGQPSLGNVTEEISTVMPEQMPYLYDIYRDQIAKRIPHDIIQQAELIHIHASLEETERLRMTGRFSQDLMESKNFALPKAAYWMVYGIIAFHNHYGGMGLEAMIKGLLCHDIDSFEIGLANETVEAIEGKKNAIEQLQTDLLNLLIMENQA